MTTRGGGGALDRIMRRVGAINRFTRMGTPAPGRQIQQQPTQGSPQPRPPSPEPARPVPAAQAAPAAAAPVETPIPVGQEISVPDAGAVPVAPPPAAPQAEPGALLGDIKESPAQQYWRRYGIMPNWFSLQVMATRRQLENQLGRPPTAREIAQKLSSRDASTRTETPTI